jgi:hypothetical protein
MKSLTVSRRFMISVLAIICLTVLGLANKIDTSMAIAMIAGAVSVSNAYQKKGAP